MSAIIPLIIAPTIHPIVNVEPKTVYYQGKGCEENN